MKIKLTNSEQVVLVSRKDFKRVNKYIWYLNAAGYPISHGPEKGELVYLHRFILRAKRGDPTIDHISGDKLDNRRSKLRFATMRQQQANRHNYRGSSKSGIRGVSPGTGRSAGKWAAHITQRRNGLRGKIHLGYFATKLLAARARRSAEIKYFGEVCPVIKNYGVR